MNCNAIFESLSQSSTLQRLIIHQNWGRGNICGASILAPLLEHCSNLEKISVTDLTISDTAEILPKLLSLPKLQRFSWDRIIFESDASKTELIRGLSNNNTLQSLSFIPIFPRDNQVEPFYEFIGEILPQAICHNTTLKQLGVPCDHMQHPLTPRQRSEPFDMPISVPNAWLQLVRDQNHTLERVSISGLFLQAQWELERCFDHHLQMNALLGAGGDTEEYSIDEWISLLEQADGLNWTGSIRYEVLRMSPFLVNAVQ